MSVLMLHCPLCAYDRPTPHTTGRLPAVNTDMAELLAVVALRETSLGFVRLYPERNIAKAPQFQYLTGLFTS
jgi:hypothetical protein